MAKEVTLKTLAKHLNISPSLACRALNDKYGVSEEMRELVKKTAKELNYIPRLSSPASENKKTVLLLLHVALFDIFKDNSLYGHMLKGLVQRLEQGGIQVEPVFTQNYTSVELFDLVKQKQPCGIISLSNIDSIYVSLIASLKIPFVMIDPYHYNDATIDLVRANNFSVGYHSAKHLIELEHRNIAFVGNTSYSTSFQNRFDGFLYYIKNCDIKNIRWQCVEDNDSLSHVCQEELLIKMLRSPDRPSAISCANDNVANEVYKCATKLGISVPKELSLIGCDNNTMPNTPSFTTFDLFPEIMGKVGAELLLKRIEAPDTPAQYLQIEPQFLEGVTTAPPKK